MWDQLQDTTALQRAGGAVGGLLALWQPDVFTLLVALLFTSNVCDWFAGRHAARKLGTFSRTVSREGLVNKAIQLTILLLLRTFEALVPALAYTPPTNGVIASSLVALLFLEDIESLERHGIVLGGKPIPGLSRVLRRLRAITGSERRKTPDRTITPPEPKHDG